MKRTNISIFIPHAGCPHKCSFCNQTVITSSGELPDGKDIAKILQEQRTNLAKKSICAEIAFFGGSFTAIDRNYMTELMETAKFYCNKYPDEYVGIRCSTRPDCIDDEILTLLKNYGMTTIELGAQSMDDEVLLKNMRGHCAGDIAAASHLIRDYGFSLGLQMMTGLYGATVETDMQTAIKITELKPDFVRIYPTVILPNTYLGKLFDEGKYSSFSFEETVSLCAEIMDLFEKNNIKIARVGLHASDFLGQNMQGGVYHPAFREICESRRWLNRINDMIKPLEPGEYEIMANSRYISRIVGYKRSNMEEFEKKGFKIKLKATLDEDVKIMERGKAIVF